MSGRPIYDPASFNHESMAALFLAQGDDRRAREAYRLMRVARAEIEAAVWAGDPSMLGAAWQAGKKAAADFFGSSAAFDDAMRSMNDLLDRCLAEKVTVAPDATLNATVQSLPPQP